METILQDLPHVCVYLDDILVTGPNEQEHLTTLEEVFRRLDKAGVRLKRKKCVLPSIEYLGHRISGCNRLTARSRLSKTPQSQPTSHN